jgi:hypothetical protein
VRGSRVLAEYTRNESALAGTGMQQPDMPKQMPKAILEVPGILYDQLDIFLDNLDILEPGRNFSKYLPIFSGCLGAQTVSELLLSMRSISEDRGGCSLPAVLSFMRKERNEQKLNPDNFPIPPIAILSLLHPKLEKAALECEAQVFK